MNVYLKQYQKNEVETSTPEKILILLYDGAINFLNKAKIAMKDGDITLTHTNIMGCEKIILEFMNTLDMKEGKELAKNLYNLYEYLYNTLVKANMNRDMRKVEEVLTHLKSLRETWQKAITIALEENRKEDHQKNLNDGKHYDEDGFKDGYGNDDDDDYDYEDDEE